MSALLTEIVGLLTDGITEFASGIGAGIGHLVQSIFVTTGENGVYTLSVFGGVCVVFAGVSLSIGLSRFVLNWVTSFGN